MAKWRPMMRTWSGAWIASSAPSTTWVATIYTVRLHHPQARHKITTPMIVIHDQARTQGEDIFIDFVDHMITMNTHAPTQGEESFIDMLVHMNALNKKYYTMTAINMIAMPTMGMTTNPTTTSSTTWTRHLIASHMLMLKTKVIKLNLGVISQSSTPKPKWLTNAQDEIANNGHHQRPQQPRQDNRQHHLPAPSEASVQHQPNSMVGRGRPPHPPQAARDEGIRPHRRNLEDEENMYGKLKLNMPKFKGEDDAEAYLSWAIKVDKIFRIHNYSGAKKVAMDSLEFEDYASTWWEQVVIIREEKGEPPIDTWEEMKEEMQAHFVPAHYMTDLFNKLQKLKQGTKTVDEFYKEMELTMMRANIQESENQTIARFSNGLKYPIKWIVEFQKYSNMVELVHQAFKTKCGTQGHKSFECKNTKVMITMENGDIETLSEGEYEALVQDAVANEEEYDEDPLLCVHDPRPSLVVTRVLTTQPQAIEDQRCNIFQTRAGIGGKSIKVIVDGGSCHNLASTKLCEKLNLTLRKHRHPYHVQWLSDKGNVKIQHTVTVTVNFKIGPYEDTIECDVVPMTVCHMLLGRPWQYDKKAIHDGHSNVYTFKVKDKKFELRPITPSEIIADNVKALARTQQHNHHGDLRGEGMTHLKESERHKPYMSDIKSVLITTKSEWREVQENPSTTLHYVLICKGPSFDTNAVTNIPSSLLSLLK
ncbi:hypothetical protein QYE76_043259 [Lolium multiflorum]|uniref:Retrotransposon gag domain-containing protein n=1 Tax=Lolium multiflorum TaxID=4521 RepID=A0AAD8WXS1_LOLMU|nr:hypothetical protein QYE76_043259 [Lolium multiflorum]